MNTQEIECRFLEINKAELTQKLLALGAEDEGEKMVEETVIYDKELKWVDEHRFVRLRKIGDKTTLTYKDQKIQTVDGTYEIEFDIADYKKAEVLFEKIGLFPFRHQEKLRHTFHLQGVTVDIDTWSLIPAYVELEGESEEALKKVAALLDLNWEQADFHNARWVIENVYHIPVSTYRWYTFDKSE